MKKYLLSALCLLFSGMAIHAQILVMDIIQVKEGMEADYEAVEAFVSPIQEAAVAQGRKLGWFVFKRLSGGDLTVIKDRGIGDYMLINVYKDEAQRAADDWNDYTAIAQKVYKGKMRTAKIDRRMATLIEPRKDTRTYVLENIYFTKAHRTVLGDTISVFPAQQLNEDYEQYEMEVFRPVFEDMILAGAHRMWHFNRIVLRSENAYQNLTHIIFNKTAKGSYTAPEDFKTSKLMELGIKARKGFDVGLMKLIMFQR